MLHAVAALRLGVAGQAASLRAIAVGAGLWALAHWLFARSRGYYAGALGRRVLWAVLVPGLDPTRGTSSGGFRLSLDLGCAA